MQLAGCNRSIVCPITLVLAYGKSFVSLLLAPWSLLYQWMLVWRRRYASLSFQRAVTPTKLTCAEFVHTYEGHTDKTHSPAPHVHACQRAASSYRLPSLFHPSPFLPVSFFVPRADKRTKRDTRTSEHEGDTARTRTFTPTRPFRPPFQPPPPSSFNPIPLNANLS